MELNRSRSTSVCAVGWECKSFQNGKADTDPERNGPTVAFIETVMVMAYGPRTRPGQSRSHADRSKHG